MSEESLNLFKEQYSKAFQDAKLSKDIEDAFFSATKESGLGEGEIINKEWLDSFMKKFMNSDSIKNILRSSQKSNKEKNYKD